MKLYTPSEAANKLGISVRALGYWRRTGRIAGIEGGNTTMYTEEQIAAADRTGKKPGPKPREAEAESKEDEPQLLCV